MNANITEILSNIEIRCTLEKVRPNTIEIHPQIKHLLLRERITQHTPDWYAKRKLRMTASDIASILNMSKYASKNQIFKKKTGRGKEYRQNPACQHGLDTEDEAGKVYEAVTGIELVDEDIGLLVDEKFDCIGASPDRVAKYFPIIIEIKCPYKRVIEPGVVPSYYMPQVQVQMQVCDIDECHFVQYIKPTMCESGVIDITVVKRDRVWFNDVLPQLLEFWESVKKFYIEQNLPIGTQLGEPPKRKRNVVSVDTDKKYVPCLFVGSMNKHNHPFNESVPIRDDSIIRSLYNVSSEIRFVGKMRT